VLCCKSEGRWFDPSWCHWNFSLIQNPSDRPMALGLDSASNRNEYQEDFSGGKGGRCVRLTTLPPSCAVVTKSGSPNLLEPSGPVQACNGTDLPLPATTPIPTRPQRIRTGQWKGYLWKSRPTKGTSNFPVFI